jgi:putative ABC transport system substrate-binding protein
VRSGTSRLSAQALRDSGYLEGQTAATEYLFAGGQSDRYAELLAQLVRLKVDVIVVGAPHATLAAKSVTESIPIVMVAGGRPVERGIVASLAQPGGNVTGLSTLVSAELFGKCAEVLKEGVPRISSIGTSTVRPPVRITRCRPRFRRSD